MTPTRNPRLPRPARRGAPRLSLPLRASAVARDFVYDLLALLFRTFAEENRSEPEQVPTTTGGPASASRCSSRRTPTRGSGPASWPRSSWRACRACARCCSRRPLPPTMPIRPAAAWTRSSSPTPVSSPWPVTASPRAGGDGRRAATAPGDRGRGTRRRHRHPPRGDHRHSMSIDHGTGIVTARPR